MAAPPLLTVITACMNAERTLPRTLESIRGQHFGDVEVLIVDGGSTDGTMGVVAEYRDVVTSAVSERDRGVSDAFNKGLARARGTWVGFINADDWYEPGALQAVASAVADDVDVLCGRLQYWDAQGTRGAVFDADPAQLRDFMSVNHMATFARRTLFERHGGFRTDYRAAMDYELFLRFLVRGARFRVMPDVLANMSLGGISDRQWLRATREVRRAQRDNGVPALRAWGNWGFQVAKGGARRALERAGAGGVVEFYRNHLARVRKHTPR